MRINNTQNYKLGNNKNQNISHKGARQFLRALADPNDLRSTIILETAVTGGRGYNAYKRGGVNELRERAFDDVLAAVFWMKGVDFFNQIGDWIGKKFLGLETTKFDVGKDALRTPLENLKEKVTNPKLYTGFKFTKIILSTLLSTAFVGFALPKINQAITKNFMSKDASKKVMEPNTQTPKKVSKLAQVSIDDFEKQISNKNKNQTSFKGLDIATVAHALENNKICKLLSSDVGITSGRVISARNKDEGIEYLFRDAASCIFYTASTPFFYSVMQKATNSNAITTIDPVTAKQISDHIIEQLKTNGGKMNADSFAKKILGELSEEANEILKQLKFNNDVISLDKLKEVIKDTKLLNKAEEMAKLQPKQAKVGAVLTKQQVIDVLKDGSINTAEFMTKLYNEKFGEKLTDSYRFIPMKDITGFRDNIEEYIQAIIKKAQNDGVEITEDLVTRINKKGLVMSGAFRAVAIGLSALFLGVIIPKAQYAITKYRTGSDAAPGLREYENQTANA